MAALPQPGKKLQGSWGFSSTPIRLLLRRYRYRPILGAVFLALEMPGSRSSLRVLQRQIDPPRLIAHSLKSDGEIECRGRMSSP